MKVTGTKHVGISTTSTVAAPVPKPKLTGDALTREFRAAADNQKQIDEFIESQLQVCLAGLRAIRHHGKQLWQESDVVKLGNSLRSLLHSMWRMKEMEGEVNVYRENIAIVREEQKKIQVVGEQLGLAISQYTKAFRLFAEVRDMRDSIFEALRERLNLESRSEVLPYIDRIRNERGLGVAS